jgi:hypothetical protein
MQIFSPPPPQQIPFDTLSDARRLLRAVSLLLASLRDPAHPTLALAILSPLLARAPLNPPSLDLLPPLVAPIDRLRDAFPALKDAVIDILVEIRCRTPLRDNSFQPTPPLSKSTLSQLDPALSDPLPPVRAAAIRQLPRASTAASSSEEAMLFLERAVAALGDADDAVALGAALALADFGDGVLPLRDVLRRVVQVVADGVFEPRARSFGGEALVRLIARGGAVAAEDAKILVAKLLATARDGSADATVRSSCLWAAATWGGGLGAAVERVWFDITVVAARDLDPDEPLLLRRAASGALRLLADGAGEDFVRGGGDVGELVAFSRGALRMEGDEVVAENLERLLASLTEILKAKLFGWEMS